MVRPCLMLSEIVQYADGCLVGDQPELQSPRRCCEGLRPEIAISAGQTSNHDPAGEAYRYRCCSPSRPSLGFWVDQTLLEPHRKRGNLTAVFSIEMWTLVVSQSLTSRLSMVVTRLYPRDAPLVQ